MNRKNFSARVQEAVSARLGDDYQVIVKEMTKNNNINMEGLLIYKEGQNVAPAIYLEPFRECYRRGEEWQSVIDRIIAFYESNLPTQSLDMSFYRDFSKVKKRIIYKLINAEQNRELLNQIPHIGFLDLAICFCYAIYHKSIGDGTILITNSQVEMWDTNTVELLKLAQKNTIRMFGMELQPMENVLNRLIKAEYDQDAEEDAPIFTEPLPMKVLSNRKRQFGAAVMLYPGVLQEIAEDLDGNLYILPSSVHEVIIMGDTGAEDPRFLKEMVREVNATQVLPEEILSEHVYYYDREKREVTVIQ